MISLEVVFFPPPSNFGAEKWDATPPVGS